MDARTPTVTQLAVFVENAPGRLAEIADLLGRTGVNIRGFSVADTVDFGIVRLLVADPVAAAERLRGAGFAVHETELLCVDVPDVPGGLAGVLRAFSETEVNIEYMYSAIGTHVCFAVGELARASELLEQRGIKLASQEELALL